MNENPHGVRVGQEYQDTDSRPGGRIVTVEAVDGEPRMEDRGRFYAGRWYATCRTSAGVSVKIDTRRLASSAYLLIKAGS